MTPVQTRVLDRWPDGGPKWVLVDARCDVDTSQPTTEFEIVTDGGPPSHAVRALTVQEAKDRIQIGTTGVEFGFQVGASFPFSDVRVGGAPALIPETSGLRVDIGDHVERLARVTSVTLEERGPLRTVVRLVGELVPASSGAPLEVTARVHCYAGLPTARVVLTLTNPNPARHPGGFWDLGDPGSLYLTDASLVFKPPHTSPPLVRASIANQAPWTHYGDAVEIYQESSGGEAWQSSNHLTKDRVVPHQLRGYRVQSPVASSTGTRATPIVAVANGDGTLAATMKAFWENFPKAVRAGADGLTVSLFPAQYPAVHEIQGGEQKTHDCFVTFGRDTTTETLLEWCRTPSLATLDADAYVTSGAVSFLAPLGASHRTLVDAAVDGADSFQQKREVIDEYGWRHFGEIYGDHEAIRQPQPPLVSHYNNQYDPVAGFAYQFMRTGDPRWWAMMRELSDHVIDIDVYHTTRDKSAYNHGLFWHTYHYGDADTATHRTYPLAGKGHTHGGGPSADHNYTTGLMLDYFLTGNEAARQTVIDLAQFVIDMDDGGKTRFRWLDAGPTGLATLSNGHYGPGRGPANSLNAVLDGHRLTGDRRFLDKADEIIRRVVHPQEDIARHRLDDPEHRWFYTMFLQSLGKYLEYKASRGDVDEMYAYGRESLLHYARWMAEHEYPYLDRPEKLQFPTETWAAQDIRKSDVFYFASRHATGDERSRFIERGRFFHDYAVNTLASKPTRALARPVIVLLTSGLLRSWAESSAAGTIPSASPRQFQFPRHRPFVPQKARALQRAKIVSGLAFLGTVAAGVLWFVR